MSIDIGYPSGGTLPIIIKDTSFVNKKDRVYYEQKKTANISDILKSRENAKSKQKPFFSFETEAKQVSK